MPLPESVKRAAAMSDRKIRVVAPDGDYLIEHGIESKESKDNVIQNDVSQMIIECVSQIRALAVLVSANSEKVCAITEKLDKTLSGVSSALTRMTDENNKNIEPRFVKPIYDAKGKLMGAERVTSLEQLK